MKRFITLLLIIVIPCIVNAKEITKSCTIKINGSTISSDALDNKETTFTKIKKNSTLTIESKENIQGIYLEYELTGGKGVITNGELTTTFGENALMHDYIDVYSIFGDSKKITLTYSDAVSLTEIYIIGDGDIPSFVEIWNAPVEKADLLLFTTHSDDEQLFFSGLLPNYVAKGANVQVVYFTKHNNTPKRYHELLHGLYTVGIRNYPIIGIVPDKWADDLNDAIKHLKSAGLSETDALNFQVEMIRRFKPLVIVSHDEKGEYGHGQHQLCTYLLERAIDYANDSTYDIDSYNKYGTWSTKKVYLHLYPKNKIEMDYDIPLDYFGGKTAFQVSQDGFKKHVSQKNTWFTTWLFGKNNEITKSTEIKTYSPREYGLFRSLVGPDVEKNDMFENLSFYKDIEDIDTYFNKEVEQTIAEEPMPMVEDTMNWYQIVTMGVILLSGLGILILLRKL